MITPANNYNPNFGLSLIYKCKTSPVKDFPEKEKLPEVISSVMEKIENAKTGKQASELLLQSAKNGDFKVYNGVRFKNGEYQIQNIFSNRGMKYEKDLKILDSLNLDIVPKYIKTVVKDKDMFILTKIPGCKSGNLMPYSFAKNLVSKENKMSAYRDLKKLTKAGYTDDKVLNLPSAWFVTPDDKKIVIPSFESFRKLKPDENKEVLNSYHRMLFS